MSEWRKVRIDCGLWTVTIIGPGHYRVGATRRGSGAWSAGLRWFVVTARHRIPQTGRRYRVRRAA